MKKLTLIVAVSMATLMVSPAANADTVDSVTIIDAYFNKSALPTNATEICVADSGCSLTPTKVATSSTTLTHGTIMAQIVAKNNPTANIILIRAGSVVGEKLYQASAREITKAFMAVPDSSSVVSISIYNNGNGCRPNTANAPGNSIVNVSDEVEKTKKSISDLVNKNISIISASGNGSEKNINSIDYPACLPGVTAVAKASSSGQPRSQGSNNSELDLLVYPSVGLVGNFNTTSGITAAVAAKWSSIKAEIVSNSKQFIKLNVLK